MIYFLHNPKTAGQSFISILESNYLPDERDYLTFDLTSGLQQKTAAAIHLLTEEQKKKLKIIHGHVQFGIHEFFPDQPARYFTFLRNPVQRVISHYQYVKSNPSHYLYNQVHNNNMSVKDYVQSGISPELNNGQVRLITGQLDSSDPTITAYGANEDKLLEQAIQNIETHFDFVGLQEYFTQSVSYIANTYNWKHVYYPGKNINKDKNLIVSPDDISAIEKFNQSDSKLYNYILNKFKKNYLFKADMLTLYFKMRNRFVS